MFRVVPPWRNLERWNAKLPALLATFLTVIVFDPAIASLPVTPTFTSYHQNTETGKDTTMNGITYFSHYFERQTGTSYVFTKEHTHLIYSNYDRRAIGLFFFPDGHTNFSKNRFIFVIQANFLSGYSH